MVALNNLQCSGDFAGYLLGDPWPPLVFEEVVKLLQAKLPELFWKKDAGNPRKSLPLASILLVWSARYDY